MRAQWLVLLLLASSLVPVASNAQTVSEEVILLEDSGRDINVRAGGASVPYSDRFSMWDLRGLSLQETPDELTFRVQVENVDPDNSVIFIEDGVIFVHFLVGDLQYQLEVVARQGQSWGYLNAYDEAGERYYDISFIQTETDAATESFVAHIPRQFLRDSNGAVLHPDMEMTDFWATSRGLLDGQFSFIGGVGPTADFEMNDAMPDDLAPQGLYTPIFGAEQYGHIYLGSQAPVRASNGEATTYVFEIEVTNTQDFEDDVTLTATGIPAGWDVRIPADELHLRNFTTLEVPVLVTVPFAHEHGAYKSFIVEAQSDQDPTAYGRIELGVRFTEIPQPAGHHPRMWLHSAVRPADQLNEAFQTVGFGGGNFYERLYFNAAEFDENDAQQDIKPTWGGGIGFSATGSRPVNSQFTWEVGLEPGLQMGLDFDIERTGTLSVPIHSIVPLQGAVMSGDLYAYRLTGERDPFFGFYEAEFFHLGIFNETAEANSGPNSVTTFDMIFEPTDESDLIHFSPEGISMWMSLYLETTWAPTIFFDQALAPVVQPGGVMELPLNEYHDPVDDLFHHLTDVDIIFESEQERYVNSGETVLFELRIENTGVVHDDFTLSIDGVNHEWATILGDETFRVRAGDDRRVVVAVAAPLGSEQSAVADLILLAQSEKDPEAQSLVRLYAEVDDTVDHEDQSHLVPVTAEELTYVPVGAWITPLALLGAMLVLRRSRRI